MHPFLSPERQFRADIPGNRAYAHPKHDRAAHLNPSPSLARLPLAGAGAGDEGVGTGGLYGCIGHAHDVHPDLRRFGGPTPDETTGGHRPIEPASTNLPPRLRHSLSSTLVAVPYPDAGFRQAFVGSTNV